LLSTTSPNHERRIFYINRPHQKGGTMSPQKIDFSRPEVIAAIATVIGTIAIIIFGIHAW